MDPEQQFRLLAVAALVDGHFAPEERAVLLQHSRALGLELADAERVIRDVAGGTSPATSAPSDPAQRAEVFAQVVSVLVADGELQPAECAFLRKVAPAFGVHPDDAEQRAREAVASSPDAASPDPPQAADPAPAVDEPAAAAPAAKRRRWPYLLGGCCSLPFVLACVGWIALDRLVAHASRPRHEVAWAHLLEGCRLPFTAEHPEGGIVVCGTFRGSLFLTGPQGSRKLLTGAEDVGTPFVLRLTEGGDVREAFAGDPGWAPRGVALDAQGDAYVIAVFAHPIAIEVGGEERRFEPAGDGDVLLLKLRGEEVRWVHPLSSEGYDRAGGVAVTPDGPVFAGTLDYPGEAFVAAYTPTGAQRWRASTAGGGAYPGAVTALPGGGVRVLGHGQGANEFAPGQPDPLRHDFAMGAGFVADYSAAGAVNRVRELHAGFVDTEALAEAPDGSGFAVLGRFDALTFAGERVRTLGLGDTVLCRYDAAGQEQLAVALNANDTGTNTSLNPNPGHGRAFNPLKTERSEDWGDVVTSCMTLDAQGRALIVGGFAGQLDVERFRLNHGLGSSAVGLYLTRVEPTGAADLAVVLAEGDAGEEAYMDVETGGDVVVTADGSVLVVKALRSQAKSRTLTLRGVDGAELVLEGRGGPSALLAKVRLLE